MRARMIVFGLLGPPLGFAAMAAGVALSDLVKRALGVGPGGGPVLEAYSEVLQNVLSPAFAVIFAAFAIPCALAGVAAGWSRTQRGCAPVRAALALIAATVLLALLPAPFAYISLSGGWMALPCGLFAGLFALAAAERVVGVLGALRLSSTAA